MPIIESTTDPATASYRLVSEFTAPIERVWALWEDPRQVERWWGPPGYPATFHRHDFTVPGRSVYDMAGPDGSPTYAGWSFLAIDPPRRLEIANGFADVDGEPTGDIPWNRFTVEFEPNGDGTRMTITASFDSVEVLEQMLGLGMVEGMSAALGQIDDILREPAA